MNNSKADRPEQPSAPSLANAALKSASSLMGLQLLSRLVTFVLNQALVRLASPAVYGMVSIQLELLLNTILFLSREGFRNALLRVDVDSKERRERVSNIALLPVYFGILISFLTSATYFYFASGAAREQPFFILTVLLYTSAAVLELFSEPMHIRSVQSLNSAVRIQAEGSAVIAKSITTVAVLAYDSSSKNAGHLGLLAFALGQLSYSVVLLLVYLPEYRKSMSYTFHCSKPKLSATASSTSTSSLRHLLAMYFDEHLLEVSLAMTAQGFVKHILTEGDKIVISRVSPLKDQGGYAVANNYGALVARIFLQPIEETSRLLFSKMLSSSRTNGLDAVALQSALSRLGSVLLIYSHLSLFLLSLAPPYLSIVLSVMLPPRYMNTSAPVVLSAWVWYVPVLAVNGVLEAFVSSVASPKDLAKQSQWMAGASVAYIILAVALYNGAGLGDTAIVYANIANLVARISYCIHFLSSLAARDYKGKVIGVQMWKDVLPHFPVLISFGVAAVVTRMSARVLAVEEVARGAGRGTLRSKPCLLHLGIGTTCGLTLLAVCFLAEKQRIRQFVSLIFSWKKTE